MSWWREASGALALCPTQRQRPDSTEKYVIVEVKADNQIDAAAAQTKWDFAQQIAVASDMEYMIIKSTNTNKRRNRVSM